MRFILKFIIVSLAVFLVSKFLKGIYFQSALSAFIFVAVFGILNILVKPLLVLFTIPITILTLGLFLFVINAVIVLIADAVIPGFDVANFWWALLFSIIISVIQSVTEVLFDGD